MKVSLLRTASIGLTLAAFSQLAQADSTTLTTTTWTPTGTAGLIAGDGTIPNSPTGNTQFGYVSTWSEASNVSPLVLKPEGKGSEVATNGSKVVSSSFSALANDSLTLYFNFLSTDGRGYQRWQYGEL